MVLGRDLKFDQIMIFKLQTGSTSNQASFGRKFFFISQVQTSTFLMNHFDVFFFTVLLSQLFY